MDADAVKELQMRCTTPGAVISVPMNQDLTNAVHVEPIADSSLA